MNELYDIIDRYLGGELQGKELSDFERRMQTDAEFAGEVELYKRLKGSLSAKFKYVAEELALEKTLQNMGSEYFSEKEKPSARVVPLSRRRWLAVASAAAAMIALLIWQPWQQSLYKQYAHHPIAELIEKGASAEVDLSEAEDAFNKKDYKTALPIFRQYLQEEENKEDIEVLIFSGICQLELGEYEEAQSVFNLIYQGKSAYKSEGVWYLALLALKRDDINKSRQYLLLIPEDSDRFQEAQRLLSAIN